MNREDIEHMWKVASNDPNHDTNWHDPVVIRFAALVASAEREACIVDIQWHIPRSGRHTPEYQMAMRMIKRIRARGQA